MHLGSGYAGGIRTADYEGLPVSDVFWTCNIVQPGISVDIIALLSGKVAKGNAERRETHKPCD
jgi:hypothetical protein